MYCARKLHIPRNRRTAFLSVGTGILVIASILDSSGLSPLVVTLWPMNGSSWSLNFSFFWVLFEVTLPASFQQVNQIFVIVFVCFFLCVSTDIYENVICYVDNSF